MVAEDDRQLYFSGLVQRKTVKQKRFTQPLQDYFLFFLLIREPNIRCTHVSYSHIFAISFLKQAHIIPLINTSICGVNNCKMANFYNHVPII